MNWITTPSLHDNKSSKQKKTFPAPIEQFWRQRAPCNINIGSCLILNVSHQIHQNCYCFHSLCLGKAPSPAKGVLCTSYFADSDTRKLHVRLCNFTWKTGQIGVLMHRSHTLLHQFFFHPTIPHPTRLYHSPEFFCCSERHVSSAGSSSN